MNASTPSSSGLNPRRLLASRFVQALLMGIMLLPEGVKSQGAGYQTRNVFIVIIDGIRNNEAFEPGDQYMRCLWDSLRPQGTIYSNFRNSGVTVTNAAHSTIVTGVRQYLPNNSGIATPVRPKEPTIGECYRKQLGVSKEHVYYVSGKNTIWRYPVSLYPGYGYSVSPTIALTSAQDTLTWDSTRAIMARDHPSLCYVLFAQVDAQGHTGDTTKYLSAIRRVDSLIYLLWKNIESDPVYAGKTTMIVSSDHGRHDDVHGGWQAHGDHCHGCRHIPFLAIGPDIRSGVEIPLVRDQIDIAPTVAHLLGFAMPFAQGSIMSEMLVSPGAAARTTASAMTSFSEEINLSNSAGLSRSPSIAVNGAGLHVVYTDNSAGRYEAMYTRSSDHGKTWSAPLPLFSPANGDDIDPDIASLGDSTLFIAVSGYRYIPADSSGVWMLMGRRSTNGGASWEPEFLIDTLGNFSCKPSISTSGNRISIVTMSAYRIMSYTSLNGGSSFSRAQVHTANSEMPACTLVDTTCYAVWHHLNSSASPFWNVLWDDKPWQGATDKYLTKNDTNSYSYDPSIAYDNNATLYVAFSHLADASSGNSWGLRYVKDGNLDGLWSEPANIVNGRACFSPVVKVSERGTVIVVWADLTADGWAVRGSRSTDEGTTWSAPFQISSAQSFIAEPDMELSGDTMYVVWQDLREGNWETYFKKFAPDVTETVPVESGWNMISLPVIVPDGRVTELFPTATSRAFEYAGSAYVVAETLRNGCGYWLKFDVGQSFNLEGIGRFDDTIAVREGWNMIGSTSARVPAVFVGSDPSGIVTSQFFTYRRGYETADTIQPGRAYWIKTSQAGSLILGEAAAPPTARIRIVPGADLPPPPPLLADTVRGGLKRIPEQFALRQSYPNPFNPAATIEYDLREASYVTLELINVLGQVVATIVEREQQAGRYAVQVDGSGLPSGVYVYRLTANSLYDRDNNVFTEAKRLLLLK